MVEPERQLQANPQHARHHLDDLIGARMIFERIAKSLGGGLDGFCFRVHRVSYSQNEKLSTHYRRPAGGTQSPIAHAPEQKFAPSVKCSERALSEQGPNKAVRQ
jgi:hypothetical protein